MNKTNAPITFSLVTEHGPGGSNPVVRFRGPRDKMVRLVSGYLSDPHENASMFLDRNGRFVAGLWQIDLDVVDGTRGAAYMVAATMVLHGRGKNG